MYSAFIFSNLRLKMIQIGDVVVSFDVLREKFLCDLNACKGACCVEGDAGAPVELDEIEKLCQLIAEYGFEKYITIDLGMLTEYDYYTGMIFRGYTYGTGDAVVKGGRYDHLIGQFGKDAASVGFAVVLDELMLALSRQKIDIPTNEEATMVLYEPEYRSTAIRTANALRNINQAVSMMKKETDRSLDDYKAYSRRYHIAHILYVDQDKELTKIDISDDSVLKMPVPEF